MSEETMREAWQHHRLHVPVSTHGFVEDLLDHLAAAEAEARRLREALAPIVARFDENEAVGISTDEYEVAKAALTPRLPSPRPRGMR